MRLCDIDGCNDKHTARGYCLPHWRRWYNYGDPLHVPPERPKRLCSIDGCDNKHNAHGYCARHLRRFNTYGDPLYEHPEPPCGTRSKYNNYKCRCDECRAANTADHRDLIGRPPPTHGLSGYNNYGCRCDICTATQADYIKRAKERKQEPAGTG